MTAQKQESSEQYNNKLVDEYLHWEGPNDHFAESRMIQARRNSEEIHLFYRDRHHSDFIYFGKIEIVNVEIDTVRPSKFVFHLSECYQNETHQSEISLWNHDQMVLAFNSYLKLPFGKLDPSHQEIEKIATLIGKSKSEVALKLNNFAFSDPYNSNRGLVGLPDGADQAKKIWSEFMSSQEDFIFESERILAEYRHETIEEAYPDIEFDLKNLKGEVKIRSVKTRVNQSVFRKMVLKTYSNRCAISGINIPDLLITGHIVPWAENEHERLNPENGLCLSNLYDRAYEKGLICIDTEYKVLISKKLKQGSSEDFYQQFFGCFENKSILIPKTYQSRKEFLEYRLNRFEP